MSWKDLFGTDDPWKAVRGVYHGLIADREGSKVPVPHSSSEDELDQWLVEQEMATVREPDLVSRWQVLSLAERAVLCSTLSKEFDLDGFAGLKVALRDLGKWYRDLSAGP